MRREIPAEQIDRFKHRVVLASGRAYPITRVRRLKNAVALSIGDGSVTVLGHPKRAMTVELIGDDTPGTDQPPSGGVASMVA